MSDTPHAIRGTAAGLFDFRWKKLFIETMQADSGSES